MTYASFLAVFIGLPLLALAALTRRDARAGRRLPAELRGFAPAAVIAAHVVVAVVYTTPWDNYLVASGVWFYDPAKVAVDWILGYVPLEEYAFFVLQTVAGGLWLLWWLRRRAGGAAAPGSGEAVGHIATRWAPAALATAGALAAAAALALGAGHGRYLALVLVWALPPIAFQLAFGGDILWRHRGAVGPAIATATLYLSAADTLAIRDGVWTIAAASSTGWLLPGGLPIEEFVFFLATNVLVGFGVTLVLATASRERARRVGRRARRDGAVADAGAGAPAGGEDNRAA